MGGGCGATGITCTFWVGGSNAEKWGSLRKKKFFINNSVEALISFNEKHHENSCTFGVGNFMYLWGGGWGGVGGGGVRVRGGNRAISKRGNFI